MKDDILSVLRYFEQFSYAPTLLEGFQFLPRPYTQKEFSSYIQTLEKTKVIQRVSDDKQRVIRCSDTPLGYANSIDVRINRAQKLVDSILPYISILSRCPSILLIGISGSVAMLHADEDADVDIFIITKKHRLWTGRMCAVVLAELFGKRRRKFEKNASGKLCLNLFFDGMNLKIPHEKQTPFVAHELLQMKPVYVNGDIYRRLIDTNRWVFEIYPNAYEIIQNNTYYTQTTDHNIRTQRGKVGDWVESIMKNVQLPKILKNRTQEIITDTQLWFFPDDVEKRIRCNVNPK